MISCNSFLKLSFLFVFISCQSTSDLKRENRSEFFANDLMKTESFFLPKAPDHLNFSYEGECFINDELEFLDFKKLNASYNLSYEKLIELQAFFFSERIKYPEKDKNILLYEVIEKISGNVRFFDFPKYAQYHFVWIDGLEQSEKIKWLKRYLDSRHMEEGVPIVMSLCQSSIAIEKFLNDSNLSEDYPYVLGREIYNNYNDKFEFIPKFQTQMISSFKEGANIKLIKNPNLRSKNLKSFIYAKEIKELTVK